MDDFNKTPQKETNKNLTLEERIERCEQELMEIRVKLERLDNGLDERIKRLSGLG